MGRQSAPSARREVAVSKPRLRLLAGGDRSHGLTAVEQRLLRALAQRLGRPSLDLRLWDGRELSLGAGSPVARLWIRDRGALYRLWVDAETSFGDLYASGRLEVEGDLALALETVYRALAEARASTSVDAVFSHATGPRRVNTVARSRSNVHHHYDIGNDFYELWLDADHMQYTCAYYPQQGMTLEQAQRAKLEHVCRKVRLRRGDRVVEAGGGWGGLALYMAREYDARVRSYNISAEQVAYARERAAREGLATRVEFIEDDYRSIDERCDVFVSVGMLEHVGPARFAELGRAIDRSLGPTGRGLIHSIGRNRPAPLNRWIEKRIFPGSYPPTLGQMMSIFEPFGFSVVDVENLRLHYHWTLRDWLARYQANEEQVRQMFDERFVRTWRLYLAGSSAAFATGSLQLFQVVFQRPLDNELPRSRAHLYVG
jgi:cyclopropane-fatty-acyl-phospholipid synthase